MIPYKYIYYVVACTAVDPVYSMARLLLYNCTSTVPVSVRLSVSLSDLCLKYSDPVKYRYNTNLKEKKVWAMEQDWKNFFHGREFWDAYQTTSTYSHSMLILPL